MQVNEHILKVSGKIDIPEGLELGSDHVISLTGQIVKVEDLDNQDGTCNKVYVFKPMLGYVKES